MQAILLLKERRVLGEDRFADVTIWRLPKPLPGNAHVFKYRLALVDDEVCVLRFNNEAGKGDHKHVGGRQVPYAFTTLDQLVADFWQAVENWRPA
jgi:hypothetical protein